MLPRRGNVAWFWFALDYKSKSGNQMGGGLVSWGGNFWRSGRSMNEDVLRERGKRKVLKYISWLVPIEVSVSYPVCQIWNLPAYFFFFRWQYPYLRVNPQRVFKQVGITRFLHTAHTHNPFFAFQGWRVHTWMAEIRVSLLSIFDHAPPTCRT